jgi:putative membrane protein
MVLLAPLVNFILYFVVALVAEVVFIALYISVTPHREMALIRQGNVAAAISLAGAVLGFTLPLASVIAHAVSLIDLAIWSVVALIAQLVVFFAVDAALRKVSRHIEDGNVAAATTLAGASLAIGLINAACMTP